MHLWERECSIQRRYQKVVELAPSMTKDRSIVAPVIEAAVRIAKKVRRLRKRLVCVDVNAGRSTMLHLERLSSF
jgi:pyruvate carboxylase